jgi:hypothetical protein
MNPKTIINYIVKFYIVPTNAITYPYPPPPPPSLPLTQKKTTKPLQCIKLNLHIGCMIFLFQNYYL